jgi:2-iminobutanoate/2-iminopropanoate deaminase
MLDGVETRGVLWDVGGVLVEFTEQPTGRRRWQARLGLDDGELEARLWSAMGSFGVAETEAIAQRLARSCALSQLEARQLLFEAHEHWRPNATLMTFATSLRSAGVPTAVVSNAWAAARWAFEAILDVRRLTDVVVISAAVGVEKPDPAIYRLATDALGVDRRAACSSTTCARTSKARRRSGSRESSTSATTGRCAPSGRPSSDCRRPDTGGRPGARIGIAAGRRPGQTPVPHGRLPAAGGPSMETVAHNPTEGIYPAVGDYIHALEVRDVGRLLFVAGTMGLDADGAPGGSLDEQLRLIWSNIRTILASAGMTVDNVVRVTSYLRDVAYADANADARVRELGGRLVPTTAIVVQTLEDDWLVEVEVVAAG